MTAAAFVCRAIRVTRAAVGAAPLCALLLAGTDGPALAQIAAQPPALAGTSWRLVSLQRPGEADIQPADDTGYTLDFQDDGRLRARVDCNGGRGRWASPAPGRIEFGPLGLTREQCKPGSLHDRIVRDWRSIRTYEIRANHLFLSVDDGGGTYEFRPLPPKEPVTLAVASVGPVAFDCTQAGKPAGSLQATFYETQPAMVLVERDGRARPAFAVPAAKGAQYAGADLVFAEIGRDASVVWGSTTIACRRR
jgi:heat shock protein HslJ